ncbi:MAG TPA: endo-1,4-beta-xylanase [Solirubrobacteraceae bacterium]|nr:endo-1,4-beta-xylanase [Solirubrobacteraceae bacterium]
MGASGLLCWVGMLATLAVIVLTQNAVAQEPAATPLREVPIRDAPLHPPRPGGQITELDVGTSLLEVGRPERLQRQALACGEVARACNAVQQCTRLTTWGFTDAVSWLRAGEAGLLFDGKYRAKPAYTALRSAFAPRVVLPIGVPPP